MIDVTFLYFSFHCRGETSFSHSRIYSFLLAVSQHRQALNSEQFDLPYDVMCSHRIYFLFSFAPPGSNHFGTRTSGVLQFMKYLVDFLQKE